MKTKPINLEISEEIYQLLWNQKEEVGINRGADMSWEEFFISAKNKKLDGEK